MWDTEDTFENFFEISDAAFWNDAASGLKTTD